jgi:hypothetical protein
MVSMRKSLVLLGILFLIQSVFAAPWDFLRVSTDTAQVINPVVIWVLMLISLGIFAISVIALKKKGSQRLLFVSGAFGLFFLKGVLSLVDIYVSPGIFMNFAVQGVFDLLILIALFIAIFRK